MIIDEAEVYLAKAEECLAGAESEFVNGRYNNCANRCYYACFQAAVSALIRAGIRPSGREAQWSHAFVQAQFASQLITRRKLYPADLRDALGRTLLLRQTADYEVDAVTQTEALRVLRRARALISAVHSARGESP
jgi:uncharacterized protein (UPF0332 family)